MTPYDSPRRSPWPTCASGGRLDVGLGVGYVEADFTMFGVDYHDRGNALDELVPVLRKAFTGEPFTYRGTTVRVTPRPVQDPMPIFIGGASPRGIERAVQMGDGYFPPGHADRMAPLPAVACSNWGATTRVSTPLADRSSCG